LTPEDFNKLISEELKRQIPILIGYDSSIDSKTGIFLGFVFLVFIQVILLGSFVLKLSTLELEIYAIGILFLFGSIIAGMIAYFSRGDGGYPTGVDITETISAFIEGADKDYESIVQDSMLQSFIEVLETAARKLRYTKYMAGLFAVGIAIITALALWSIYTMVA
jgi:hypothetical protein